MLNISRYIGGAPISNNAFYVIFHGFTGALDKVPFKWGNFLVNHRGETITEEDLRQIGCNRQDVQNLLNRGYLTMRNPVQEKEMMINIASAIHEEDLLTSPPSVMIVPTYICNLRCPYCFQDHKMHAGKENFSKIITTEQIQTVFKILDDLVHQKSVAEQLGLTNEAAKVKRSYPHSITLFGGEPLAAPTLPIIPEIIGQAASRGMKVSAITNGVELHLFSEYLGTSITELQITVDGREELHDRRRIGPGFKKTFQLIADNISLALEKHVSVNLRINVDEQNFGDLKEISDLVKKRGWNKYQHFNSHASSVHTEKKSYKEVSPDVLVEETMFLRETEDAVIESYEIYARDFLKNCLLGTDYPFKSSVNCAAESGLLIFDSIGDVYACWEDVGYSHLKTGTYDKDGLHLSEIFAKQWLTRFPGNINECSECPYALIHKSGCASHARKTAGTIYSNSCETFKEYFPKTLSYLYEKFEESVLKPQPDGVLLDQ